METQSKSDDVPISIDLIDCNLYLGNLAVACDVNTLENYTISHVLTIDTIPLPRTILDKAKCVFKFVKMSDVPKEDLLNHLAVTNQFIADAISAGGTVLVHCYFGVSRSAAIVIAYLMWRDSRKLDEVCEYVRSKRTFVRPNHGFMAQLKLYDLMECHIDRNDPRYKQFRLRMAGDNIRNVKILPQTFVDLVKPDPGATSERPEPKVYRCKKCRRVLATFNNIIPHIPRALKVELAKQSQYEAVTKSEENQYESRCQEKNSELTFDNPMLRLQDTRELHEVVIKNNPDISVDPSGHLVDLETVHQLTPTICREMFFVEPLAWMAKIHHETLGKLNCPKCSTKVGSFSWIMGCKCPCGKKVAPAFYLVPSKVEFSDIVQNVLRTV